MVEHPYSECKQHGDFRTLKGCSRCADEAEITDLRARIGQLRDENRALRAKLEEAKAALHLFSNDWNWRDVGGFVYWNPGRHPKKIADETLAAIHELPKETP